MQIACMTTTKAKQTTTATKAEPSLIDWKGAHASEASDPRDTVGERLVGEVVVKRVDY